MAKFQRKIVAADMGKASRSLKGFWACDDGLGSRFLLILKGPAGLI